jgi:hypothetical protein
MVAGEIWKIPTKWFTDADKTFKINQALVTMDGDSSTVGRYRIDPDAADSLLAQDGHYMTHGDEIMLRHPKAIANLRIYTQATGTGGTIRVTLMG